MEAHQNFRDMLKAQRKKGIDPASREFDIQKFEAAYERSLQTDDCRRLHVAALWFAALFEKSRRYQSTKNGYSAKCIGTALNELFVSFAVKSHEDSLSPTDAMEYFYEGAETLLRGEDLQCSEGCDPSEIAQALEVQGFIRWLEERWARVVYHGWNVRETTYGMILESGGLDFEYGRACGLFRYQDHMNQLALLDAQALKNQGMPDEQIDLTLRTRIAYWQTPFYLIGVVETIRWRGQIGLSEILAGWSWLMRGVLQVARQGEPRLILKRNKLVTGMTAELTFSREVAEACVDFFVFESGGKQDLWQRPLISVGEGAYLILMAPFLIGNFQRVAELLLKEASGDESAKGRLFEHSAAEAITAALETNILINDWRVYGPNIRLSKKEREIDLVVRIGETFLLLEIKANAFPVGAIADMHYLSDFSGIQVRNAAKLLDERFDLFVQKHMSAAERTRDWSNRKVVPAFLSSLPFFVGTKADGVPIVDISVLERYFGQGDYSIGEFSTGRAYRVPFYKTAQQAEQNLKAYLDEPEQIRLYRTVFRCEIQKVRPRWLSETIFYEQCSVNPSEEDQRMVLESVRARAEVIEFAR